MIRIRDIWEGGSGMRTSHGFGTTGDLPHNAIR